MMHAPFHTDLVMVGYGTGFVLALYLTFLLRSWLEREVWRAGSTMQLAKVSAYQLAMLNGGVARVALTGVVRLLGQKVLVAGIAGVLTENGEAQDAQWALDVVEREALSVARQPLVFKDLVLQLELRLNRSGVTGRLRSELIGMGYMWTRGSKDWWKHYARNMLPFAVLNVMAIGALAGLAMTPDARDWLVRFSAVSVVAMLIVALPRRVTALGRYMIWSATQHHPDLRTARAAKGDTLDIKALGQSIALYGPDALAGSDMAWIPAVLAHTENTD
jgi:uncharacterized protein (TIGR04222 family)